MSEYLSYLIMQAMDISIDSNPTRKRTINVIGNCEYMYLIQRMLDYNGISITSPVFVGMPPSNVITATINGFNFKFTEMDIPHPEIGLDLMRINDIKNY